MRYPLAVILVACLALPAAAYAAPKYRVIMFDAGGQVFAEYLVTKAEEDWMFTGYANVIFNGEEFVHLHPPAGGSYQIVPESSIGGPDRLLYMRGLPGVDKPLKGAHK